MIDPPAKRSDANALISLLYVSQSRVSGPSDIRDIVIASRAKNPLLGITGALVFTGGRFAQILEGLDTSVDALMQSITRDQRHEDIVIAARRPITETVFKRWALAYWGEDYATIPSGGRGRAIYDAIIDAKKERGDALEALMQSIAF